MSTATLPKPYRGKTPTTDAERRKLLAILADKLDLVPQRQFDIGNWAEANDEPTRCAVDVKYRPECGTAACVAGWATYFIPQCGLRLTFNVGDQIAAIRCKDDFATDADIAESWGISEHEAHLIIFGSSYQSRLVTPKQAAARIREVLAKYTTV